MAKQKRLKPGPKPDPTKTKATMVSAYLSERRKQALRELSKLEDDGIIAVVVTRAIEETFGERLDQLEQTL